MFLNTILLSLALSCLDGGQRRSEIPTNLFIVRKHEGFVYVAEPGKILKDRVVVDEKVDIMGSMIIHKRKWLSALGKSPTNTFSFSSGTAVVAVQLNWRINSGFVWVNTTMYSYG